MLPQEFFKKLKQVNVSKDMEKTKERLRVIWSPLAKPKREEILALCGLKKFSIERAYKSGNASAKIIAAFSQVLELDPYYLAGMTDEQSPFDDVLLIKFLADLKYDVSKRNLAKPRKAKPTADVPSPTEDSPSLPINNEGESAGPIESNAVYNEATDVAKVATGSVCTAANLLDVSAITKELIALDENALKKLNGLTEDALMLMLKSLVVQADFSEGKRERLTLIKYLLLS